MLWIHLRWPCLARARSTLAFFSSSGCTTSCGWMDGRGCGLALGTSGLDGSDRPLQVSETWRSRAGGRGPHPPRWWSGDPGERRAPCMHVDAWSTLHRGFGPIERSPVRPSSQGDKDAQGEVFFFPFFGTGKEDAKTKMGIK